MADLIDFSLFEALFAIGVLFAASLVRGYSGFGFSAVLVAGLAFIVDPIEAVPLAIGLEVLASVVQGRDVWNDIDWNRMWTLLAAAIVGNPIGVLILTTIDAEPLRAATFITLAVLTLGVLSGRAFAITPTVPVMFGVGVIAGIVNGATAMAGLVLVLAMSSLQIAPKELRGTLVAYFFASDLAVLLLILGRGELDATYGWRLVAAVPVMVLGVLIGSRAFWGSSVESFRRTTLLLLLAIAVLGLTRIALF